MSEYTIYLLGLLVGAIIGVSAGSSIAAIVKNGWLFAQPEDTED